MQANAARAGRARSATSARGAESDHGARLPRAGLAVRRRDFDAEKSDAGVVGRGSRAATPIVAGSIAQSGFKEQQRVAVRERRAAVAGRPEAEIAIVDEGCAGAHPARAAPRFARGSARRPSDALSTTMTSDRSRSKRAPRLPMSASSGPLSGGDDDDAGQAALVRRSRRPWRRVRARRAGVRPARARTPTAPATPRSRRQDARSRRAASSRSRIRRACPASRPGVARISQSARVRSLR